MRLLILLSAFALTGLSADAAFAQSCTTQWTGAAGSDFADPANWTNGVPVSGAVGCIDGNGTNVVTHSPHATALSYGVVVVGGEAGDHTLRIDVGGEILFSQLLIRPTGTFIAEDGSFPGDIENDGLIQFPASSGVVLAEGPMDEGGTIVNRGRIEISAAPTALLLEGTLINEAEGTVALIAPNGERAWLTSNDNYRFINRGLITSTGSDVGSNEGNQVGHIEALSPGFVNEGGRIEVFDGELVVSGSGGTRFESGEYVAGDGAVLRVAGGTPAEVEGTLTGNSDGEIDFQFGTVQAIGDEVTFDVDGAGLRLFGTYQGGTWRNAGTVTLSVTIRDGAAFTNEGTARWETLTNTNASFINESGATVEVVGEGNFGGNGGQTINRGLFVKPTGTNTSAIFTPFVNEAGGEIRAASGLLSFAALSDAEGSTLTGTAQLGVAGLEPMGTIAPGIGDAPGTLTWRFSQTFEPSTTLELDIAGPTPGTEHDQLVGFTAVTFVLDGTLRVRIADDYNPPVGTEFVVMEANAISGDFASVDLPDGLDYEINADNVTLRVVSPIPTEGGPAQPTAFALGAAYPNPFRATAQFTVEMPEPGRATVEAFDVLGRRVAVLHDGDLGAGAHTLRFEATDLPAGLYVLRATNGATTQTRRVTLLR